MERCSTTYLIEAGVVGLVIRMDRMRLYYIVDALMAIAFVLTMVSAMSRSLFRLHSQAGWAFIILGLVHLALHWRWAVATTKNMFKSKAPAAPARAATGDGPVPSDDAH